MVPHPFSARSREQVRELAAQCAADIAKLVANIDAGEKSGARAAIATRAIMADLRGGADGIAGGPAPFGKADRSRFLQVLDQVLVRLARG